MSQFNDHCWCPEDFVSGVKSISKSIASCNNQLSDSICILISHFVIGDKWPFYVLIKRDDGSGGYECIDIYPNKLAKELYSHCLSNNRLHQFSKGTVLLNRQTCRKLLPDKTFFEQNVVNGTKFECTSSFKGKGRIYHMW
eukprot:36165_1